MGTFYASNSFHNSFINSPDALGICRKIVSRNFLNITCKKRLAPIRLPNLCSSHSLPLAELSYPLNHFQSLLFNPRNSKPK